MSKEKPEVGDIWQDIEGRKLFLFQSTEKYLHFLRRKRDYPHKVVVFTFSHKYFPIRDFTYVGKSEVTIDQLFEIDEKQRTRND